MVDVVRDLGVVYVTLQQPNASLQEPFHQTFKDTLRISVRLSHCTFLHRFEWNLRYILLTFESLAVSLRTTRFNIQKFYMMLASH